MKVKFQSKWRKKKLSETRIQQFKVKKKKEKNLKLKSQSLFRNKEISKTKAVIRALKSNKIIQMLKKV
jgi:hypothetical protein